jgi:membrane dipeptidase
VKKSLRLILLFYLAGQILLPFSFAQDTAASARAHAVHDSAIVIDAHEDTPQRFLDENYDIGSTDPNDPEFISLDKARAGNLGAVFFSIFVSAKSEQGHYARRAFDLIDSVYEQADRHPDRMMMAFSAEDIERANQQHKLAALMGVEGGHAIENDLGVLRDFYRLGVRYMTLTHTNTNGWADSCGDINDPNVAHHNGLTDFGRQVVQEMNRLGMMVDVSHVSDKTFWDAIAVSRAPIIASHSSARALVDNPRNLSDEMLRAIGKNGGAVNVAFPGGFLDKDFGGALFTQHQRMLDAAKEYTSKRAVAGEVVTPEDTERFKTEWLRQNRVPRPPLKSLIDHIDHVAKIAGVDHVGLGSDFDGAGFFPADMDTAADLPKITQALLNRGYTVEDVRKILGGNMLRVMREVERVSEQWKKQ